MDLNKKLEELKPYQLNCNVFDVYSYNGLTMQDLLCQFFTKINECITVSNETIDLAKWLVNEGLEIEVVKKLMLWLEDGTLENIINVNIFNTLNEKINGLSSQLEQNTNIQNFQKEHNLNELLRYKYDAKCMGGTTDDTIALQNFIDDLELEGENGKGGVIQLPAGEIRINGLTFKPSTSFTKYNNKLVIRGSGINATTLICDDESNDNFIDLQGKYINDGKDRNQCAFISFENLSLKSTSSQNKVCFNYKVTQYCNLKDVWIEGFKGGALLFEDAYDAMFYNVQIIKCGRANGSDDTDFAPAIGMYGRNDCTNALFFNNCRMEFLPIFIHSKTLGSGWLSSRHIYFNNCKFEKLSYNLTPVRPFTLSKHNEWSFNNCFFVNSNAYRLCEYVCDDGLHFFSLANAVSSYVTENNIIQSTKFTNCHMSTPKLTYSNWGKFSNCHLENVDFSGCYGMNDNETSFYIYDNNIFNNVNISSKGSKLFTLDGQHNNIKIESLQLLNTNSELVKVFGSSDSNEITIYKSDLKPLLIKRNDSNDFLQYGELDKIYYRNNIIKLNNSNPHQENNNLPRIYETNDLFISEGDYLNYLNHSHNNKIITVLAKKEVEIVHDYRFIKLKEGINKRISVDSYITFKNINGVWYEI